MSLFAGAMARKPTSVVPGELLGATVHTVNFSLHDTQKRVFARDFAEAADTLHVREIFTKPVSNWEGDWTFMLRAAWEASPHREESPVPRPRLAWSGDGEACA